MRFKICGHIILQKNEKIDVTTPGLQIYSFHFFCLAFQAGYRFCIYLKTSKIKHQTFVLVFLFLVLDYIILCKRQIKFCFSLLVLKSFHVFFLCKRGIKVYNRNCFSLLFLFLFRCHTGLYIYS